MKAFPVPSEAAEKAPEQSKITKEDFDNVEAKLSVLHKDDGKESSFQDVKSAMEALYASDSADDDKTKETALPEKKGTTSEAPKKKRGRKPKSEKAKEEAADLGKAKAPESSAPAPGRERSKRASAQNASLKLQETSDEDEFYRRIDKKKDSTKESNASRKSIEADRESSQSKTLESTSTVLGLETSVERPKKLVKKSSKPERVTAEQSIIRTNWNLRIN